MQNTEQKMKYIRILEIFIYLLFFIYIMSMVFIPLLTLDWNYIQDVWDRWQSLNVGVLAFISSLIALKITKYNTEKQRIRKFIAAKAFMPHSLSELTAYCKLSSIILLEAWGKLKEFETGKTTSPLNSKLPELPESYKETFNRCISEADPVAGDFLSIFLLKLQVHNSRINELTLIEKVEDSVFAPHNMINYLFHLGELQVMINELFRFSREMKYIKKSNFLLGDYITAYENLGIDTENMNDLVNFTKHMISITDL